MAFRSYLLVHTDKGLERDRLAGLVGELEKMREITFAEPVMGEYDLVLSVECEEAIEDVIRHLKKVSGICSIVPLKVTPIPSRARMQRNLKSIPEGKGSSV
jgi:hypothetical protein